MGLRASAEKQEQKATAREFTLAPGRAWHKSGAGKTGITVTATGDPSLTYVPENGRVHSVPLAGAYKVLDAGEFDDDGACWLVVTDPAAPDDAAALAVAAAITAGEQAAPAPVPPVPAGKNGNK